jgi:rhomboid protease GluP
MKSVFRRHGGLDVFWKTSPVTSILIVINTLLVIVTLISGGFSTENLDRLGGLSVDGIQSGEYYRFLTSAFLHGSLMHYISNTIIGLIVLGSGLERVIGTKKFGIIYFSSLILSAVVVYYYSYFLQPEALTIGASGAIFGVLGSLLYLTINRKDLLYPQELQSIRMLVILQIFFTLISDNISVPGHIGGLSAGFLISFLVIKQKKTYDKDSDTYDFTVH